MAILTRRLENKSLHTRVRARNVKNLQLYDDQTLWTRHLKSLVISSNPKYLKSITCAIY